jgi:hypothetical protein
MHNCYLKLSVPFLADARSAQSCRTSRAHFGRGYLPAVLVKYLYVAWISKWRYVVSFGVEFASCVSRKYLGAVEI